MSEGSTEFVNEVSIEGAMEVAERLEGRQAKAGSNYQAFSGFDPVPGHNVHIIVMPFGNSLILPAIP